MAQNEVNHHAVDLERAIKQNLRAPDVEVREDAAISGGGCGVFVVRGWGLTQRCQACLEIARILEFLHFHFVFSCLHGGNQRIRPQRPSPRPTIHSAPNHAYRTYRAGRPSKQRRHVLVTF